MADLQEDVLVPPHHTVDVLIRVLVHWGGGGGGDSLEVTALSSPIQKLVASGRLSKASEAQGSSATSPSSSPSSSVRLLFCLCT